MDGVEIQHSILRRIYRVLNMPTAEHLNTEIKYQKKESKAFNMNIDEGLHEEKSIVD